MLRNWWWGYEKSKTISKIKDWSLHMTAATKEWKTSIFISMSIVNKRWYLKKLTRDDWESDDENIIRVTEEARNIKHLGGKRAQEKNQRSVCFCSSF